jgi:hypothetical protein
MKWEYKIVYFDATYWSKSGLPNDLNQTFDQWGSEGWELVSTEGLLSQASFVGVRTRGIVAIFKNSGRESLKTSYQSPTRTIPLAIRETRSPLRGSAGGRFAIKGGR